jgi:uncharacterized membrane protein (DUF4010 family)
VLARKAGEYKDTAVITAAILAATAVMYIRLIVVAFVFNGAIARSILLPFLFFALTGFAVAYFYYRGVKQAKTAVDFSGDNPLELGTAFIFATLFVIMILLTHAVTRYYGVGGLKLFSFIAGFTDIDPFVLSILTGKFTVSQQELLSAIIISAGSNNMLKAVYALWFGGWERTRQSFFWLIVLGVGTIAVGLSADYLPVLNF